ncbi:MAG TPA: rod shape-determining protein MreC [Firmicutes bacterium]|nr:rod shape-determining protein MreC [Bacillota bacterium]
MHKQFDFKRLRFFIILLILSLILFFFRDLRPVNQAILYISKPVYIVIDSIKFSTLGFFYYFKSQKALKQESELLRKENEYLRRINSILIDENLRYKRIVELLNIEDFIEQEVVNAKVIGRSSSQWFNSVLINKGSKHGVIKHTPVIIGECLIGRVQEVYFNTSRVMLITDSRFTASGLVREKRFMGIVRGNSSPYLDFNFEFHKKNIAEPGVRELTGEIVVTSGFDKYIVQGLVIGRIGKVYEDEEIMKTVQLIPIADIGRLEYVQVLVPEKGTESTDEK